METFIPIKIGFETGLMSENSMSLIFTIQGILMISAHQNHIHLTRLTSISSNQKNSTLNISPNHSLPLPEQISCISQIHTPNILLVGTLTSLYSILVETSTSLIQTKSRVQFSDSPLTSIHPNSNSPGNLLCINRNGVVFFVSFLLKDFSIHIKSKFEVLPELSPQTKLFTSFLNGNSLLMAAGIDRILRFKIHFDEEQISHLAPIMIEGVSSLNPLPALGWLLASSYSHPFVTLAHEGSGA